MNATTALYEGLDRPDNINPIDVNATPSQILLSIYQLWKPIANKREDGVNRSENYEPLYQEAVRLLQPHLKIFENVKPEDLETTIFKIDKHENSIHEAYDGVFLSALLNTTDLKEMDLFTFKCVLGYKLAPGKSLLLREGKDVYAGSHINYLGEFSNEALILNYGYANKFSSKSQGGAYINFGDAPEIGSQSKSGVFINYSTSRQLAENIVDGVAINFGKVYGMARSSSGGIQINLGHAETIALYAKGGIQINLGHVEKIAPQAKGGIQIDFEEDNKIQYFLGGTPIDLSELKNESDLIFDPLLRISKIQPLLITLESKVKEIEHLKDLSPDDAFNETKNYDWKAFEQDILFLGKRIEDILK